MLIPRVVCVADKVKCRFNLTPDTFLQTSNNIFIVDMQRSKKNVLVDMKEPLTQRIAWILWMGLNVHVGKVCVEKLNEIDWKIHILFRSCCRRHFFLCHWIFLLFVDWFLYIIKFESLKSNLTLYKTGKKYV